MLDVFVCDCVFLSHSEDQNMHVLSQVKTFWLVLATSYGCLRVRSWLRGQEWMGLVCVWVFMRGGESERGQECVK